MSGTTASNPLNPQNPWLILPAIAMIAIGIRLGAYQITSLQGRGDGRGVSRNGHQVESQCRAEVIAGAIHLRSRQARTISVRSARACVVESFEYCRDLRVRGCGTDARARDGIGSKGRRSPSALRRVRRPTKRELNSRRKARRRLVILRTHPTSPAKKKSTSPRFPTPTRESGRFQAAAVTSLAGGVMARNFCISQPTAN
jgi:hypothetical protein